MNTTVFGDRVMVALPDHGNIRGLDLRRTKCFKGKSSEDAIAYQTAFGSIFGTEDPSPSFVVLADTRKWFEWFGNFTTVEDFLSSLVTVNHLLETVDSIFKRYAETPSGMDEEFPTQEVLRTVAAIVLYNAVLTRLEVVKEKATRGDKANLKKLFKGLSHWKGYGQEITERISLQAGTAKELSVGVGLQLRSSQDFVQNCTIWDVLYSFYEELGCLEKVWKMEPTVLSTPLVLESDLKGLFLNVTTRADLDRNIAKWEGKLAKVRTVLVRGAVKDESPPWPMTPVHLIHRMVLNGGGTNIGPFVTRINDFPTAISGQTRPAQAQSFDRSASSSGQSSSNDPSPSGLTYSQVTGGPPPPPPRRSESGNYSDQSSSAQSPFLTRFMDFMREVDNNIQEIRSWSKADKERACNAFVDFVLALPEPVSDNYTKKTLLAGLAIMEDSFARARAGQPLSTQNPA